MEFRWLINRMHIYHRQITAAKKDTVIKQITLMGEIATTEIAETEQMETTRTMTKEVSMVAWMLGRNGAFSRLYF